MNRQQIAMKLTVEHLGLDFTIDTFDNRLIMQKAVYLAQAGGVKLGYFYRWYLRGPYCPALADDAYSVATSDPDESEGWTLESTFKDKVERLKGLCSPPERPDSAKYLELLASVHFLIDREQVANQEPATIEAKLKACDKDYDSREVQDALGELKDYGLID